MNINSEKIKFKKFLDKNENRIFEGGKRFSSESKINNDTLISIITVVKNKSEYIQETIDSIKNQKYKNIEHIIIDGVSTDGTVEIVKKNIDSIDYFVSEPDLGNYDAINKGISLCTGELIGIVNADDILLPDASLILLEYYKKYPEIDFFFGSVKKHWGTISGYYPKKINYSWFFYTSHSTGFFFKKKCCKKKWEIFSKVQVFFRF